MSVRNALAVALVLGATALALPAASTSAAAMPLAGLDPAVVRDAQTAQTAQIDQVRWVCGPYRCFWRPNYYVYGGWGGPRWGYHGPWRRW
jgi:O-acetyl-ADP-ribose deacetylase (regulator of RNase III)